MKRIKWYQIEWNWANIRVQIPKDLIFWDIFFSLIVKAIEILRISTEDEKKKPNIQRNVKHSEIRCWSGDSCCWFCKDYHCFTMRAIFLYYKSNSARFTNTSIPFEIRKNLNRTKSESVSLQQLMQNVRNRDWKYDII